MDHGQIVDCVVKALVEPSQKSVPSFVKDTKKEFEIDLYGPSIYLTYGLRSGRKTRHPTQVTTLILNTEEKDTYCQGNINKW
jgi:hypothetical protein